MAPLRRLETSTVAAAVAVTAVLAASSDRMPAWGWVAAFVAVVMLSENSSVLLPSAVGVSPSFMAIMACIAILDGEGHETLLGAAAVGAASGIYLDHVRQRQWGLLFSNCAQFLLASVTAAAVFGLVGGRAELPGLLMAVAATCAFGAVNVALVLPLVALRHGLAMHAVWLDMRPALPNYLAFGLVGLFLGLLSVQVGPVAVALLGIPMAIGRWTFSSFLRTREAHEASIRVFIRLIEAKDAYTAGHTERVANYALLAAEELDLDPVRLEHLRQSALMHDVGKLAVPSRLLNKPGRLTAEEYEVVRRHNDAGIGILSLVDFMRDMAVTASDRLGHYQQGTVSAPPDLVLEAHIVAVADAFDAMTSTRSYRRALDQDVAFEELRRHAGTQFNPDCVEALIRRLERRGERYGAGHEADAHPFGVPPPDAGVGSAGLGHLSEERGS
jgi:hypothetical protein